MARITATQAKALASLAMVKLVEQEKQAYADKHAAEVQEFRNSEDYDVIVSKIREVLSLYRQSPFTMLNGNAETSVIIVPEKKDDRIQNLTDEVVIENSITSYIYQKFPIYNVNYDNWSKTLNTWKNGERYSVSLDVITSTIIVGDLDDNLTPESIAEHITSSFLL